jgi:uncharacterized membrane protein YdfJ with MMPL/SSD domain
LIEDHKKASQQPLEQFPQTIAAPKEQAAINRDQIAALMEFTAKYSEITHASLDELLAKIQDEINALFWWVKWFVVVVVTFTVIFTMFLTVSMQFFFEKDNELDEIVGFSLGQSGDQFPFS